MRTGCSEEHSRYSALLGCALLVVALSTRAVGQVNSWINPSSGYWETQSSWSLGVLPNQSQSIYITNAGWKAVAIGANTAENFPQSMQIRDLQITSPVDSRNLLLMNFSGFQVPLQTTSLTVGSNSSVVVQSSSLETGSIGLAGSFNQGDFSRVKVHGAVQIFNSGQYASDTTPPGVYFLTNGTLSVDHGESIGAFGKPGQFVQYGGFHYVGGSVYGDPNVSIFVNMEGEFDIYAGQLTATNGILIGSGDYADLASFHQYGGAVNADMVINGNYILNGGTITGRMTMAHNPSIGGEERADAFVLHTAGTNFATSLDMGYPNKFGGRAFYTLSNGVVRVDSSVTFRGGRFSQYNGQNLIVSNLVLQGTYLGGGFGVANADYLLEGGTLSAGGLTALNATFQQDGGTNDIVGDLVLSAAPPPQYGDSPQYDRYTLAGGFLVAQNITVNASYYGGFRQAGGLSQIRGKLTVQGAVNGFLGFALESGTLIVRDIYIADGAFFQHASGYITQYGVLTLKAGEWRAAAGDYAVSSLQLQGDNTNSAITFPGGSSIFRLVNSSSQPWSSSALLYINNWHGSTSGGGATQLYFGSNSDGLTPQQLARIRFALSTGAYPATILPTGEVVPAGTATLDLTRNGDTSTLTWPPGWFLQSAADVTGPYQDVLEASSPYPVSFTKQHEFFRLRQ